MYFELYKSIESEYKPLAFETVVERTDPEKLALVQKVFCVVSE